MNTDIIRETLGALLSSALWWSYFRYGHGSALQHNRAGYCFITAPSWLSVICGRPLPDNQVELVHALGQVCGLLLSVIWLLMYWSSLDRSRRLAIYTICAIGMLIIPMATYLAIMYYKRWR
jgi:hypothetical protein